MSRSNAVRGLLSDELKLVTLYPRVFQACPGSPGPRELGMPTSQEAGGGRSAAPAAFVHAGEPRRRSQN